MKLKKVIKVEENTASKKEKRRKKITQRDLLEEKLRLLEEKLAIQGIKATKAQLEELEELKQSIQRSKRGKSSKAKGASYERTIAKKFQNVYDVELSRTPQSGGFAKKSEKAEDFRGDIIPVDKDITFKLHIECKDRKNWNIKEWLKQAQEDCPKDRIPIVIMKKANTNQVVGEKGNQQDLVVLVLEDFFSLVDKEKIIQTKRK